MTYRTWLFVSIGLALVLSACAPRRVPPHRDEPAVVPTGPPGPAEWVDRELKQLTLEGKVSQLFTAPVFGHYTSVDDPAYRQVHDLVERFGIGGIMFFQGDPYTQAVLTNELQGKSRIPLLVSQDMEWGPGMRLDHTTTFPRAMAIGATRDAELARAAGAVTAREARALGVHQVYAPVADVNNNPANPIINVRSFGEDPDLVSRMVVAFVEGVQQNGTIATLKHFPGHGDTATDSHSDLPVITHDQARLDSIELVPFQAAVRAGAGSVMTGHLAFPRLEPDVRVPASLSPRVTEDILRRQFGFQGLIVTDALNMSGVTKHFSTGEIAIRAIEAGSDMLLMSEDVYAAREAVLHAVREGRISESRIDVSVRRVLAAKANAGLNERAIVDIEAVRRSVGTHAHEALADAIATRSLTLLRNESNLLPVTGAPRRVLVPIVSDGSDPSIANVFLEQLQAAAPDFTFTPRLIDARSGQAEYDSALQLAADHDLIIVPAFALVRAWSGQIGLSPRQQAFLNALVRSRKPVVLVSLGNPYIISGLEPPDAYLVAYGSAAASQRAAARSIFGHSGFHGKLPITIPGHYAFGSGIDQAQASIRMGYPEEAGFGSGLEQRIDTLITGAIEDMAFPGAAVAIGRNGLLAYLKAYGHYTYEGDVPVSTRSQFDMASLTKVIATTTAVMKLYEAGKIDLDATVASYLPAFAQNGKDRVTVRQLLMHTGGLTPFRAFHVEGITSRQGIIDAIMAEKLEYRPGSQAKYSDFGPITVALIIEKITGREFGSWVHDEVFEPLGMHRTGFRQAGIADSTIVPTEIDTLFRKRLVQGEVHDETAWILGGTAGHAGLFSTVEDLSRFAFMMVNGGWIDGRQFLKEETIRQFTTAADPRRHTRALGWDTRNNQGYSSAGTLFGPRSFGHTGFTGTSIWIDPDERVFVILLTNRVYPTRDNGKIIDVRPALADLVHGSIEGPPEPLVVIQLRSKTP